MYKSRNIYREFNDEKLAEIRNHPYYAGARAELISKADAMLESEPPRIRFSKMHLYVTTGDRATYETDYFAYFERLKTLYLAYVITEDEKYLPELADTIWNICDFETWARPAHVNETASIKARKRHLALCSTGACANLAEVLYFVEDKLPELVVRRAKAEIQYRVIDSFAEKKPPFCFVKHNWAAVCIADVLCTYLYIATDEEIEAQLPAMMSTADNYLSGFADDACCSEGVGYWGFGFSHFLVFASMLKDYTDGKINYFENPKVKKIAMFPYRVRLNENDAVAFSDSGSGIGYKVGRTVAHILKANYPDYPILDNDPMTSAPGDSRALFWSNPDYTCEKVALQNQIFENVQWFIHHGKSYAVGAKAGHNDEFHNHNDVGSFAVSTGELVSFFDVGGGVYDRQYFDKETRYLNPICSSRGHSVPIINGEEQKEGNRGVCDILELKEGRFTFDMRSAYVVDTLESLVRDFDCSDEYFTLTDTYRFSAEPSALTERFISRLPLTLEDGVIKSGKTTLVFDSEALDVNISTLDVVGRGINVIYYVDFTPKSLKTDMSFTFKFI